MGNSKAPPLFIMAAVLMAFTHGQTVFPSGDVKLYCMMISDAVIPGSEMLIDVRLGGLAPNSEDCIVDLGVSSSGYLWHRSVWRLHVDENPRYFLNSIKVMVPQNASTHGGSIELSVESSNCVEISRKIELPIRNRELMVTIRSDKMIYNPGDTVFLETLVLTQEQKPYYKPVNLTIHNSRGDIVVRWINVTSDDGMIKEKYRIPLLARPDEMTITLENHLQLVHHKVKVEEPKSLYDKEHFEVEIRSPRYHFLNKSNENESPSLEFSVFASQFSGLPVEGEVEIDLMLVNSTKKGSLKPGLFIAGHALVSFTVEEIKSALNMEPQEKLVGQEIEFQFHAERVTKTPLLKDEEASKNPIVDIVRRVANVAFVDQVYVLFFTEYTPHYFKPGLTYIGQILLKPVEERIPFDMEDKEVKLKIKIYKSGDEYPREEEIPLKVKLNSVGEFSFEVEKEATKLEIEAIYEDSNQAIRAHLKEVKPFYNLDPTKDMMQVLLNQPTPKVNAGESLKVKVITTSPTTVYAYRMFSESLLLISEVIFFKSPSTKAELEIPIPHNISHLLSSPRLVMMTALPSKEILLDSLRFIVEHRPERRLELELKANRADLGETVEIAVNGEPLTQVFLLTMSSPLVFDEKEQEMRKQIAKEKMSRYLRYINSTHFSRFMDEHCTGCTTIPSLAPDSIRVLNETEAMFFTNVKISESDEIWPRPHYHNGSLDDLEPSTLDTVEEFESDFWNLSVSIRSTGEEKLEFVVSREARLYTFAAFGLRPSRGLVVVDEPVQLTAVSKILASLEHPENVVRGEEVIILVELFNTDKNDVELDVTIYEKPGYRLYCLGEEESSDERKESRKVSVDPLKSSTVQFVVKTSPTSQGPVEIYVEISSEGIFINLTSTLKWEYQGFKIDKPTTSFLNNFNGTQEVRIALLNDLESVVEKSERGYVKLYGHPLGPAIEHVCKEVNGSTVLEERTKMWFMLATNVLEHVSNNSLFDNSMEVDFWHNDQFLRRLPVDREECIKNARDTLDYLLHKRNSDGSVSFYPENPGFIWLSSMMLDANVLLKDIRSVDGEEIVRRIEWLINQQQEDGSFKEDEHVINNRYDPEHTRVPLTCQVVASLLCASQKLNLPEEIFQSIGSSTGKAIDFIVTKIMTGEMDSDYFVLNLAAYALALAKSDKIFEILSRRDKLELLDGTEKYFESLLLEANSYAIMASLEMNDLFTARKYVEYVITNMRPGGTYITAEDTNVALRALSQYYRRYYIIHEHEQVHVDVNVTLSNEKIETFKILSPLYAAEIYFDKSNLTLGSPMFVRSSGDGTMLVQSISEHNEDTPKTMPRPFTFDVVTVQVDETNWNVTVCVGNLEMKEENYLIAEIPILTGFDLNTYIVNRDSNPQVLKRGETIYISFINIKHFGQMCTELQMEMVYPIRNNKQRYAMLYMHEDPRAVIYMPYPSKQLDKEFANICPS